MGSRERNLQAAVTCRLCGQELAAVNASHLWYTHGRWDDRHPVRSYKRRFGLRVAASEATCEKNRQRHIEWHSRMGRHWTKERVRREIRRRRRLEKSLAVRHVMLQDHKLANAALRLFSTWDAALRSVGTDPSKVRLARAWSPEEVLGEIRKLHRLGAYRKGVPRPNGHANLKAAGKRYYGSWRAALDAAGIPEIRLPERVEWSRREVATRVRTRMSEGKSLRATDVLREDRALFKVGCAILGRPWRGVVEALGYRYEGLRRWSRESIQAAIRDLRRSGRAPTFQAAATSWPGMVAAAKRFWGDWDGALRSVGLDPASIRGRRKWDKVEVIREIRRARRNGAPLNAHAVFVRNSSLYHAAKARFGRWDDALRSGGIDPARVRRR